MKKVWCLGLSIMLCYRASASLKYRAETDTLLKVERLFLLQIKNVSYFPPYEVSGDIYLTSDRFIFTPKPYFGKKVNSFYPLLGDINMSYDSIEVGKRFWLIPPFIKLVVKTPNATYKFDYFMRRDYMFKMRKTIRRIIKVANDRKRR